jgi:hypothetical protein
VHPALRDDLTVEVSKLLERVELYLRNLVRVLPTICLEQQ